MIVLLISTIPLIIVLAAESLCLTPLVVVCGILMPIMFGYRIIDRSQGSNVTLTYVAAILCLLCGYYAARLLSPRIAVNLAKRQENARRDKMPMRVLITVVFAFVIYHLVVGGIPLLSADPEIARFNITSSGLFGIPSRMFLFGFPFIVLTTTVAAIRTLPGISRKMLLIVWGAFLLASVSSGFKSSLLSVVITFLLACAVAGKPVRIKRILSAQGLVIVATIVGSVFYVGSRYGTLHIENLAEFENYAIARSTVIAAAPGYYALTDYKTAGFNDVQYLTDFRYYLGEYLPGASHQDTGVMPLDKLVSSLLYNNQRDFIVSVTVGAFPEMFVNMGTAAYLGMFILGIIFYVIYRRARASSSLFGSGVYASVLYWMCVYVTNGSLIYYVLNLGFTITMLYLVFVMARVTTRQGHESGPGRSLNAGASFQERSDASRFWGVAPTTVRDSVDASQRSPSL